LTFFCAREVTNFFWANHSPQEHGSGEGVERGQEDAGREKKASVGGQPLHLRWEKAKWRAKNALTRKRKKTSLIGIFGGSGSQSKLGGLRLVS